jgi:hypothetical protein
VRTIIEVTPDSRLVVDYEPGGGGRVDCEGLHDDAVPAETPEDARDRSRWNYIVDGITALVLAHACAGVDIEAAAYRRGVVDALDQADNNS